MYTGQDTNQIKPTDYTDDTYYKGVEQNMNAFLKGSRSEHGNDICSMTAE